MQTVAFQIDTPRYAKCVEVAKRVCWDTERDVIRNRGFDFGETFLPESMSLAHQLPFLSQAERRALSHVQGRTYANMIGLTERFIGAKILDVSREHAGGPAIALQALTHFSNEELKHQQLFARIERLIARGMPPGYVFMPQADEVAEFVLAKSSWAVLALICHVELSTQRHFRLSTQADASVSELYKDVLFFHWKEESQHAVVDELEWLRADAMLDAAARDAAVDDLIALMIGLDELIALQAVADADYFRENAGWNFSDAQTDELHAGVRRAYRWQYILCGATDERYNNVLSRLITTEQAARLRDALAPIKQ